MRREDFEFLAQLIRSQSGLVLTPDKVYLLETRLGPLCRRRGLGGLDALCDALRARRDDALLREVVEAMTTNESSFFRDLRPFEHFRQWVLPKLQAARATTRHLRIWSAACSSGQEPYSLAMILAEEAGRLAGWRVEIVATDLSGEMLARCKEGIYSQFEVQRGLPIQMLLKYFSKDGERWRINPQIIQAVDFRRWNLLHDLSPLGRFDVVFCRNVLIYFDAPTKAKVLEGIAGQMAPDGVLFLGGAETVLGVTDRFAGVPDRFGLYTPAPGAGGATNPSLPRLVVAAG